MKKIVSFLLLLSMLVSMIPISVFAENSERQERSSRDYDFTDYSSTASWDTVDLGSDNTEDPIIEFDITPKAEAVDGLVGYTSQTGTISDWGNPHIAFRTNPTTKVFEAHGGSYKADAVIPYEANKTYHVKIHVKLSQRTYDVFITSPDGTIQQLASNYAFRNKANISDIGRVVARGGLNAPAGQFVITNHTIRNESDIDEDLGNVEIQVQNNKGEVLASKENEEDDFLVYNGTYNYNNDVIVFKAPEGVKHMVLQVDEFVGIPTVTGEEVAGAANETEARADFDYTYSESIVYAPNGEIRFTVPKPANYSETNNFSPYDPRAFTGNTHRITARVATEEEIYEYRNLAVNPYDNYETTPYNQHYNKYSFPHAVANVVTRDELRFVPRNAIDGFELNNWHSFFPYQSWAGGARSDLNFSVMFGRTVEIDKVDIILRAQWHDGHDTYWNKAVLEFSDGSEQIVELEKTNAVQTFELDEKKKVSWVHLKELEQPEKNLGFAALTELKVYGQDCKEPDQLLENDKIIDLAKKVNDYWINLNGADLRTYFWNNAVYHTGNMELYYLTGDENYRNYSETWAKHWKWMGNTNYDTSSSAYGSGFHADNHTQYQTFIDLYNIEPDDEKIKIAQYVIDKQIKANDKSHWWWIDAFYMGMPVYSKLGLLTGDTKYSNWMYEMYNHTKSALGGPGLYDTEDGLWYRDTKYIYPNGSHAKSSNGKKVYWSRGDGWVIGALVKVLQDLPDSDPHREEYESMFKIMAEALIKRQGNDGFWRRNLGDYDELPQPETSGTAFFTYAFSWGVNNGLLDKDTYMPAIIKAFNGMHATAIHPTGRVGRVQPIGENPAPTQDIGYAQTQDFGVGAVLLMLAELSKMESGIVNTDLQPMLEKNMVSTVGIKVGSNKILVGTAYKGEACHVQEIENAPIKEDGIIFVSKDFAVEQLNYTPTETIIRDSVEYASLESIAKALGKELFINGDIIVVCHQKSLFMPERDQNLLSLLDAVLTNGEFPERPKYENRFEYILPPAPKNLVPVTTVTASASPEAENVPSNVLDRNLGTRWSAESTTEEGQWIKLDFNKAIINKVGIAFHLGTQRATSYKVEVLTSAGNWVAVREKENSSGISSSYEYLEFEPVEATSVRITGYGNTVNKWSSITDVEVLATEDYSTGTWYPYFSTANWMTMDLGVGNTGNQTIEFNIQPSEAKQDGAIYYTGYDTVLDTWADAPIAVRLNTNGYFDARNGGSYAAANQIAYEANKTYKVKIMVDINAKKYSVYITGPEGNLQTLAVDYAFRLDAQAITDIGKMCARGGNGVTAGKFVILDHKISRGTTPIETYTVDLDANGGTVVPESLIVEAGSTANLPTPSRSGYKFEGWFTAATGGTKVTDQTSITSNMKLYARWTENSGDGWEPYTSTADWSTVDLGSGHTGNQVIEFTIRPLEDNQDGAIYYTGQNSLLSAWGHAPIAVRLTPSGYFDARNGGAFAATNQIKYEANKTYKVRLEVNVTSKIYNVYITDDTGKEQILAAGFVFRTGAETVTDIGKICARGGNGVAAGKFIIETHEIKAGNEPEVFYTVNFNANGGNVSQNSVLVKSGATLELPVPTRSNYEFTGWYTERTGGTEVRNDTVITADMTIYARWQAQAPETYMVIFDANGGSVDPAQMTVEAGRTIELPSPVQGGYIFKGWFTEKVGGTEVTNETVITRNMTIYAQWRIQQEIETCTVEFNGNGGSVTPARVTIEKGKAIQLPNPVRSGYDFKGWYTEKEGGTQITNATTFDKDMVVYARWAAKSNVTPEEKRLKKGETFTTGGFKYKVKTPETKAGEGKVALLGYAKSSKAKSLKVKDLVMASETKESYKVTEIAANAFKGNKNLRTVTLGKNIVTLGKNAFSKCKALKKLIIGKNVTTIGNKTFYGCSKLSRITIKSTKLKKVGNKAIAKIKKNAYIKVPSKKVKAYKKLLKAKTGYKKSMKISK